MSTESILPTSAEEAWPVMTMPLMTTEDWRVAVVVDPGLVPGELANTVALLAIGLGAGAPSLAGPGLRDRTERRCHGSANRPVPVLQAGGEALQALLRKALPAPDGALVVPFPRFARQIHVYADYWAVVPERDLSMEAIDGIGLAGPARWVRSLTGSLKLLR